MKPTELPLPTHIGARITPQGGTHFRVWAPRRRTVEVVIEGRAKGGAAGSISEMAFELSPEAKGYFSRVIPSVGDGALYRFRLDGELYHDPASRYQPEGPHGPSQVIDPNM